MDSFTIITTEPHPLAASIHDRMPLVLAPEFEAEWLDPEHERPTEILLRARAACHGLPLEVYPSDPVGNRPGVEGPQVLARVSSHRYEQQKLFE